MPCDIKVSGVVCSEGNDFGLVDQARVSSSNSCDHFFQEVIDLLGRTPHIACGIERPLQMNSEEGLLSLKPFCQPVLRGPGLQLLRNRTSMPADRFMGSLPIGSFC